MAENVYLVCYISRNKFIFAFSVLYTHIELLMRLSIEIDILRGTGSGIIVINREKMR